jgi:hypothetical protein
MTPGDPMPITLRAMADSKNAEELAAQAAEAVKRVLADAEQRAGEIVRDAEAKAASVREQAEAAAAQIRERAEGDARAQIEAAKRALDELGGTLSAAVSAAIPKGETEPQPTETEEETEPGPHPDPEPEPAEPEEESEPAGAPEAPVSPPSEETASQRTTNGDDAAERLVAMKLAVDGKDRDAIEGELTEKFGARDRGDLLDDVLSRVPR